MQEYTRKSSSDTAVHGQVWGVQDRSKINNTWYLVVILNKAKARSAKKQHERGETLSLIHMRPDSELRFLRFDLKKKNRSSYAVRHCTG